MRRRRCLVPAILQLLAASCGLSCRAGPQTTAPDGRMTDRGGLDDWRSAARSSDAAAPDGAPPRILSLPLVVSRSGTDLDRLHLPVRYQGKDVLLLLDTGAAQSFLCLGRAAPEWTPKAGVAHSGSQNEAPAVPQFSDELTFKHQHDMAPLAPVIGQIPRRVLHLT